MGAAQGKAPPLPWPPHQKAPTFRFPCRSGERWGWGAAHFPPPLHSAPAVRELTATAKPPPQGLQSRHCAPAAPGRSRGLPAGWAPDAVGLHQELLLGRRRDGDREPASAVHIPAAGPGPHLTFAQFRNKRSSVRAAPPRAPSPAGGGGLRPPGPARRSAPPGRSVWWGRGSEPRKRAPEGQKPRAQRAGAGPGFRRLPEEEAGPNGLHTPSRGGRASLPHDSSPLRGYIRRWAICPPSNLPCAPHPGRGRRGRDGVVGEGAC